MRIPRAILAAIAILLTWTTPAAAQTFTFSKSFAAASVSALNVRTTNGRITVTGGSGTTLEVRGTATVKSGFAVPANAVDLARSLAAAPPIRQDGPTLRLEPPPADVERAVTLAYEVVLPAALDVVTSSESGETRIEGVNGSVNVHTQSSRITLTAIGGTLTCSTGSGDVTISGTRAAASVRTSSSAITARDIGADFKVDTGSGRVDASFRGAGDVDVHTNSSAITLSGLNGGLTVTTNSGAITLEGTPGRDWTATTSSSAIDARVHAGKGVSLDLASRSGEVTVTGAAVAGTNEKRRVRGDVGSGGKTLRLQSGSGALRVVILAQSTPQ